EHRAAGVIFMRDGSTEERHEPVAKELVDRAFVAMDLGHRQFEEPVEECMHRVRADPLGEPRRAHDVAEEDSDPLALALEGRAGGEDLLSEVSWRVDRRRGVERSAALFAEPGIVAQRAPASRASHSPPPTRFGAGPLMV